MNLYCPLYLLIWATLALIPVSHSSKVKLCVVRNPHTGRLIEENCRRIEKSIVECVTASDRIECLRTIVQGKADFAVFEPEDLFTSMSYEEAHILVTHELRLFPNTSANYEMVVLVREGIQSMADLHEKRFCHPGYDSMDNDWTPIYADYMQNQIIPKGCDSSLTLLENRFEALSQYFHASCFPGVWAFSSDWENDARLKSKYRSLCAICENRACQTSDMYHGRSGAVKCLTENAGDVAWVRLSDAQDHFKMANTNTSQYKFLCPDGTLRNYWGKPCAWITRPLPVVGARRDIAMRIAKIVDALDDPTALWQRLLLQLLEGYRATPVRIESLKTPEDFLHQFVGLSSAYARSTCYPSRMLRWCVASNIEDRKCQWLHHSARAFGFEPEIRCLQQAGRNASLEGVAQGFCDFYIAQPEDLRTAREKNLTVAVQLVGAYLKHFHNVAILVKSDSHYKTLEDLQGARVCFPKYRSVGWNAFVALMSNRTQNATWTCSDRQAMSTFFKSVIIPGEDVPEEDRMAKTFECLTSGVGDVAFMTLEMKYRDVEGVRRICVEDYFDPECILTWSSLASVVVAKDISEVRRREIISFLEELNTWFGVHYPAPTPAISLYQPYDGQHNVIFPELAVNVLQNVSYIKLPRAYPGILDQLETRGHLDTCGSGAPTIYSNILIMVIVAILIQ